MTSIQHIYSKIYNKAGHAFKYGYKLLPQPERAFRLPLSTPHCHLLPPNAKMQQQPGGHHDVVHHSGYFTAFYMQKLLPCLKIARNGVYRIDLISQWQLLTLDHPGGLISSNHCTSKEGRKNSSKYLGMIGSFNLIANNDMFPIVVQQD